MKNLSLVLVLLLLICGPAPAASAVDAPTGWDAALAEGHDVRVTAEPLKLVGGKLSGLALRGAWVLRGDRREFGGFSGLLVRDGRLYAVSDRGWWLGAEIAEDGDGAPLLRNARMARMRDASGETYGKSDGDAEGLSWDSTPSGGERLAVSFERDHRIMRLGPNGKLGDTIAPAAFGRLHGNRGIEGLARLPGGKLIALAEGRDGGFAPVFVLAPDGGVSESRLSLSWLHSVTGADVGPDGRLYLVLREYSALFGISIRVVRYQLGANNVPLPESARTLAAFEADSGIDNMEGIALDVRPDGADRLWLISDDNFRGTQRTVLIKFDILP